MKLNMLYFAIFVAIPTNSDFIIFRLFVGLFFLVVCLTVCFFKF